MAVRFLCECGMAFTVETVRPGRPVSCPACGAVQPERPASPLRPSARGRPERPAAVEPAGPAAEPDRPTQRCRDCGALNRAEDVICGVCGTRLNADALLARPQAPPRRAAQALAAAPADAVPFLADDLELLAAEGEERRREPIRYEGAPYVPIVRLILRMLIRPRAELETLVAFLSYRDMVWKLAGLFLVGVVGLWAVGMRHPAVPIVRGFTIGAGVPSRASWYLWLGMAFSTATFITVGLTLLSAAAGLLTGHGWHLSALALAYLFVVSLVNAAHLLLLPVGLWSETAALALAWVLLFWEVMLTTFVIQKVLDCDAILSVIIALAICAVTVHFYNRVYRLVGLLAPAEARPTARLVGPHASGG